MLLAVWADLHRIRRTVGRNFCKNPLTLAVRCFLHVGNELGRSLQRLVQIHISMQLKLIFQ